MRRTEEGISESQLCHTPSALSAVFDEPNLIACAGLVAGVALADRIGLRDLADEWLMVPGSSGCAGAKVMSLVVGMLAGADSIDDMDLLRHGGMDKVFTDMRPVHVGVVPAQLHLRSRPPAGRGRLPVPHRAG